jgi:hypothetical protein
VTTIDEIRTAAGLAREGWDLEDVRMLLAEVDRLTEVRNVAGKAARERAEEERETNAQRCLEAFDDIALVATERNAALARAERAEEERDVARATQRELHRRVQESESTAYQKLRSNFFSGEASLPDTLEGWRIAAARRMRDYLMVRNWWRTDYDLYRGQRDAERARAEKAEAEVERLREELDEAQKLAADQHDVLRSMKRDRDAAESRLRTLEQAVASLLGSEQQTVGGKFARIEAASLEALRAALKGGG